MENGENTSIPVEPRIAVVIPTFNNASTLAGVIDGVKRFVPDIIVVNDGSTDTTEDILSGRHDITVITFPENRGKGRALQAGFEKAAESAFTHVITIDSDGQHFPDDIPRFIEKINAEPETLWIGNRILPYSKGVEPPGRSTFGRRFGNFWYKFIANIKLNDTQCGFRAYPLSAALAINSGRERFDYEQELLIRLAWNGTPVKEIPIRLYYQPREQKVTHFRTIKDFLRISRVNCKYATIRVLNPFVVLDVPGDTWKRKIVNLAKHEIKANTTPGKAALSVAVGVFMALSPFHGFQVIIAMGLSFIFHLNRPLTFLGVSVSSAPMLPFILLVEFAIGKFVVPPGFIQLAHEGSTLHTFLNGAAIFIVGSFIFATAMSILTYFLTQPMFKKLKSSRFFKKNRVG